MNTYDANVALWVHLSSLTDNAPLTLRPDEIFDPKEVSTNKFVRRGEVLWNEPETVGFRRGAYTRTQAIYQIALYVPRTYATAAQGTLQIASDWADAHVDLFFPTNGRGLSLTQNDTEIIITRRPNRFSLGRLGGYWVEICSVEFFVDDDPPLT